MYTLSFYTKEYNIPLRFIIELLRYTSLVGDSIAHGVPHSRKTDAENAKAPAANTDIKTDDARQVAETETKEVELRGDKKRSKRLPDAIVVGAGKFSPLLNIKLTV